MCTVNEDDLDIDNLNLDRKTECNLKESFCRKCSQEKAAVVLRTKDAYCRECFLKYATHKFRATLGKSKLVKPNDRILLATSGSLASATLLHLIAEGLSEKNNKRFLFTSLAVYIDEGAILNLSTYERMEGIDAIVRQSEVLGFPLYVVQLSNSLEPENIRIRCVTTQSQPVDLNNDEILRSDEQLRTLFNSTKSLTSKEDLLSRLRYNLLLAITKELNCNKLLLAETGSQLAVQLLTNISLGRGANLPLDVGFCDTREQGVMILKPLKEFMSKEVAFYCVFHGLRAVTLPSLSTKTPRMASIRRLTEDFLFGLNVDFPSTLSAVIKTGDKLAARREGSLKCILCKGYIERQSRDSSSLQATQFSLELMNKIRANDTGVENEENEEHNGASALKQSNDHLVEGSSKGKHFVEKHLCYGCRLIVVDMDNADELIENLLATS